MSKSRNMEPGLWDVLDLNEMEEALWIYEVMGEYYCENWVYKK